MRRRCYIFFYLLPFKIVFCFITFFFFNQVSERLEYTEQSGGRRVSVMTKMGSSLKPVYTVTEGCVAEAISVQKKISAHIEGVLTRAATFQDFSCTSDGRRSTGQGFPMSDTESVDENISEQMPVEPFLLPSAGMVKRRSDRGLRRSMAFSEQSSLSNGGAALTEGGSDSRPPSLRNLSVDTSSDCGGVRISLSFEQLESESDVMVVNAETGTVSDENAFLHRFRHTQTYFDYVNGSADDEGALLFYFWRNDAC